VPDIKPGQRFRDTQRTAFGGAAPDWVVDQVFVGTDGKRYAQVCLANDPKERKTLSTAVLLDRRRFVEVR
jgi:hypothetical protein